MGHAFTCRLWCKLYIWMCKSGLESIVEPQRNMDTLNGNNSGFKDYSNFVVFKVINPRSGPWYGTWITLQDFSSPLVPPTPICAHECIEAVTRDKFWDIWSLVVQLALHFSSHFPENPKVIWSIMPSGKAIL